MAEKEKHLLRLTTAGSVDDGKSTLIGRLLLDSGSLYQDQIKSIKEKYLGKDENGIDLALFTDGLKEEREKGITIDVAYRYFETPACKFVLADSPGHLEYTKNMVTAASNADTVILLVDVLAGITEQTRRHAYLASLLCIDSLIICVNKMDLIGWDEDIYLKIVREMEGFLTKISFKKIDFIPVSALNGDNVVHRSTSVKWYKGKPLLKVLENVQATSDLKVPSRLSVQFSFAVKEKEYLFAGQVSQGAFRVNDTVQIMPSGSTSQIKSIHVGEKKLNEAVSGMSVMMNLSDDIRVHRGNLLLKSSDSDPVVTADIFKVKLCWLGIKPAMLHTNYILIHASAEGLAQIERLSDQVDVNSLTAIGENIETSLNAIVDAQIHTDQPLVFDSYSKDRNLGSFILADPVSNETVAAGIIM